jgi:K+-transporting ATPase KdpF subunit
MSLVYWISALIAVALSIYLLAALLKPEWFE